MSPPNPKLLPIEKFPYERVFKWNGRFGFRRILPVEMTKALRAGSLKRVDVVVGPRGFDHVTFTSISVGTLVEDTGRSRRKTHA